MGVYLLFLDRLVYVYTYPQEQLSQHFAYLWRQNKYRQALELLDSRRTEQQRLMLRSALFMGFWLLLAIFSLTSSLSMVGRGAVMGMMAHVLFDSWRLQKFDPEKLNKRLFWPIKRAFSREEQMWLLIIMTVLFGVLSLWV